MGLLDTPWLDNATPPADDSSAFTKGLRSGMLGLRSQATTAAGGVVDALSSMYQSRDPNGPEVPGKKIARELYESGRGLALDAAAAAPPVSSYKDVSDLRSGFDYVTGLVGQSLPTVVPAVAGALIAKRPIVGSTAALAVPEAGDVIQRQQDATQPVENMTVGDLARSAAGGVGSAAIQSIVPAATAAKLAGRTAATAAKNTGKELIARSAASIPVEAGAEAGAEAFKQTVAGQPFDSEAIIEAGVGGAAAGGAMGAAGGVGEALHGAASRAGTTVRETLTDAGERAGDAVRAAAGGVRAAAEKVGDLGREGVEAAKERGGLFLRDANARFKTVKDAEGNPEVVDTSIDLTDADAVAKSDASTTEWARAKLEGWINDAGLDQETRAKAHEYLNRVADPAARAEVKAMDAAMAVKKRAGELYDTAKKAFDSKREQMNDRFPEEVGAVVDMMEAIKSGAEVSVPKFNAALRKIGVKASGKWEETEAAIRAKIDEYRNTKPSKDYGGARAMIGRYITEAVGKTHPEALEDPQAMDRISDSIRMYVEAAKDGKQPEKQAAVTAQLRAFLGDDTITTLDRVFNALHEGTKAERERFYDSLESYDKDFTAHNSMASIVQNSLKDTSVDVADAVEVLRKYVRGEHVKQLNGSERVMREKLLRTELEATFGKDTDKVLQAFEKEYEDSKPKAKLDKGADIENEALAAEEENADDEQSAEGDFSLDKTDLEFEKPRYSKLIPSLAAHRRDHPTSTPQVTRLLAQAREQFPDRNVSFVPARDLMRELNLSEERMNELTEGSPDDYGSVVIEGMKQRDRITEEEGRNMLLDSKAYANSPSRINTNKHGVTLDAHKITRMMLHGAQRESQRAGNTTNTRVERLPGESEIRHIARAFFEGLGSAMIHFNAEVKSLPADLVVYNREGREPVTFKQIKQFNYADPLADDSAEASKPFIERGGLKELSVAELQEMDRNLHDRYSRLYAKFKDRLAEETENRSLTKKAYNAFSNRLYKQWRESDDVVALNALMDNVRTELHTRDERSYSSELTKFFRDTENMNKARQTPTPTQMPGQAEAGSGDGATAEMARGDKPVRQSMSEYKAELGKRDFSASENVHVAEREFGSGMSSALAKERGSADTRVSVGLDTQDRAGTKRTAESEAKRAAESEIAERTDVGGVLAGREIEDQAKDIVRGASTADATIKALTKEPPIIIKRAIKAINDTKVSNKRELRNANDAVERLNAALGETLKKSPDSAYSLQLANEPTEVSEKARKHVEKYIKDVLGERIKVEWKKMMHAGEFTTEDAVNIIRLSVHALDPMGTAYHESLHAFFKGLRKQGLHDVMKVLYRASESAPVMNQMKALLKGQPEAIKQLSDPEERVAYMYQFYAQEKLKLGPDTRNVLQKIKDFILRTIGIWSNDQRAEHIMEWFHEGHYPDTYADANAVAKALMEPGTNKVIESAKRALMPLRRMEQAILSTGAERLRDTENPALVKLAHLIAPETGAEASDVGFIQAYKNESAQRMNKLARKLKGHSAEDIQAAHAYLRRSEKVGGNDAQTKIIEAVREYLDEMRDYMRDKTVRVRDLGYKDDYFPRVWDIDYISAHQDEFIAMLNKIIARGDWDGDPHAILKNLLSHDGSELGVVVDMPGMQHTKERILKFITPEDAAPFVEKSLLRTLNSYTVQAARRAEWAQRFGDDGAGMRNLLAEAKDKHGATQEEIDTAQDFIRSIDGTLGDDISPAMRRMFGNMIVYQNIRLLPLAIFSQMVDPGGILVRGGTFNDAFKAFKRGITEIPRGFKKNKEKDEWYELAETIGAIDDSTLAETLGSSYTQGMVSDGARKWNDALFKFNLVEQFTNSMRVSAVEAAVRFIGRHGDGKYSEHSTRWMEELGLEPKDVVVKDGKLLVTHNDYLNAGYDEKEALARSNKMKAAVNKWVDGAILRPNAANKPIWMNDPHYALIAHLKQFVYAFQDTILKRAFHEAAHGNYGPALALAGYVPMMIAADLVKGMIQGGGEQPQWKKDWGFGQYLHSGIERAGLYGVGQFSTDLLHGNMGSILGPTIEQLGDAVRVVGGNAQFDQQFMKALPANALYAGFLSGEGTPENTAKFTR